MKKFVLVLSVVLCLLLTACSDSAKNKVDTNSASYQQGYSDGVKDGQNSVFDDPDEYGLIRKEEAADYVVGDYSSEEAEADMKDWLEENAEDYGYHK